MVLYQSCREVNLSGPYIRFLKLRLNIPVAMRVVRIFIFSRKEYSEKNIILI